MTLKRVCANIGLILWFQIVYWISLAFAWAVIGVYLSHFDQATFV